MLRFHTNVYVLPQATAKGPTHTLRGCTLPTLVAPNGFLATFPVTFEPMQSQLAELPRCDCEPDGFFLLTGGSGKDFWRLNGHMHEYEEQMHRVELNGECPAEALDVVLRTLGWPEVAVAFELVQEGVALEERAFRIYSGIDTTCQFSSPNPSLRSH